MFEKYEDGHAPAWLLRYTQMHKRKETFIEKRLRQIIYGLGIYGFRRNYYVYAQGHHHFIDWAHPATKLGFEADSKKWHKSLEKDLARDLRLESVGWAIFHFSSTDIIRRPDYVAARIVGIIMSIRSKK